MDRLRELEVFVAVADSGGFAKAGRQLRLSPPAITRAIASLEDRLGAPVFNRTTRSVSITDVGRRFLESAQRVLAELDGAEKAAVSETTVPQGHLTITASVTLGRSALAPVACAFLGLNPRVSMSMLLLDRVANLVDEGIDVAVRVGSLPDSNLIARRVGAVRRVLVASPNYLKRRGVPRSPDELRVHSIVAFTGLMPDRQWRFMDGRRGRSVSFAPRLEVNDALAALAAAEAGEGIAPALSYMVKDRIEDGRLVTVLDPFSQPAAPVNLLYAHSRVVSPKVRAFVDFATPHLRATLDTLAVATDPPGAKAAGRPRGGGAKSPAHL